MIEWIAPALLIGGAAAFPGLKKNDKKKLKIIMENIGYGIAKKSGDKEYPKYRRKDVIMDIYIDVVEEDGQEKEVTKEIPIGTTYRYTVPLGLPASKLNDVESQISVFADGLQKPVDIDFGRANPMTGKTLNINVYDNDLPDLVPYSRINKIKDEWVIPLGKSVRGMIWHNFDHIPHMTIAGTTRFGKTVLLRVIMTYLIECHPEDVEFYIIDLKGGLEFSKYESIKQVKAVASNLEESHALLTYLTNQYPKKKRREKYGLLEQEYVEYRKQGISNIVETPNPKRKFLIVDEGAQLAPDKFMNEYEKKMLTECQSKLSRLASVGGALGYRLLFATQYPTSDTMPRQIKQNADAKITFRLPSGYASGVAIDSTGAEKLPSNIKGRALFKTHELREMQVPFLTHKEMWKLLEKYQTPIPLETVPEEVIEMEAPQEPQQKTENTPDNVIPFIDLFNKKS